MKRFLSGILMASALLASTAASAAEPAELLKKIDTAYDELQTFAARSIQPLDDGRAIVSQKMCDGHRPHIDEIRNAYRELSSAEQSLKALTVPLAGQDDLLKNIAAIKQGARKAADYCRQAQDFIVERTAVEGEVIKNLRQLRALAFRGMRIARRQVEQAQAPSPAVEGVADPKFLTALDIWTQPQQPIGVFQQPQPANGSGQAQADAVPTQDDSAQICHSDLVCYGDEAAE